MHIQATKLHLWPDPDPVRRLRRASARRDPTPLSPLPPPMAVSTFSGDETTPFFGFRGTVTALVFCYKKHPSDLPFPHRIHPYSSHPSPSLSFWWCLGMGATYGMAKSGVGVAPWASCASSSSWSLSFPSSWPKCSASAASSSPSSSPPGSTRRPSPTTSSMATCTSPLDSPAALQGSPPTWPSTSSEMLESGVV